MPEHRDCSGEKAIKLSTYGSVESETSWLPVWCLNHYCAVPRLLLECWSQWYCQYQKFLTSEVATEGSHIIAALPDPKVHTPTEKNDKYCAHRSERCQISDVQRSFSTTAGCKECVKYLVRSSDNILWTFPFSGFQWSWQLTLAFRIIEVLPSLPTQRDTGKWWELTLVHRCIFTRVNRQQYVAILSIFITRQHAMHARRNIVFPILSVCPSDQCLNEWTWYRQTFLKMKWNKGLQLKWRYHRRTVAWELYNLGSGSWLALTVVPVA